MIRQLAWFIRWVGAHAFVFMIRVAVLFAATWTMSRVINEELGYRMEPKALIVGAILNIVVVRIWMPWSSPKSDS